MTDHTTAAQAAAQILTYLGFAQAVSMEPGVDPRRDHIQALLESALLYQLRAPVSDIREGFELTYGADADNPACASDLTHFTNGWRACIMSQVRAPVADERAALQKLVHLEDMRLRLRALHESGHGTDYDYYHKALPAAWEAARAALASAPVVSQACQTDVCQAAKADGVLCANDECDRANGVRPDNTAVICPSCAHQFRAIPVQVQNLLRGAGYKAPFLDASAVTDGRQAVAYLDLGAGGYMDVGTDLTDEQLAALPKGRHMLAIIGTHGVDGYTPASAPVAGDGKTRVPGDHLGGPVVAWDDGAQSVPNRPESRASTESKGGALGPVAGEVRMPTGYRVKVVDGHGYRITPPTGGDWVAHSDTPAGDLIAALLAAPQVSAVTLDAAVEAFERSACHQTYRMRDGVAAVMALCAAPQASEAVRDCNLEHARNLPEVECRACELKVISSCGSKGCPVNDGYAGLSAQPADKPAISSPSSAGNPCPAPVPADPETGNSHTDGGAVYG